MSYRSLKCCLILLCLSLGCVLPSWAQVNGAIYTSDPTGTQVNGNIYDHKADVYLNGGPQNKKDPGLVPDGVYYFQVTDPSGAVLLSQDDISCRQVVVSGGRIVGVPSGPAPNTCADAYHQLGTFNTANGQMPVQLCSPNSSKCSTDFADTPNPGGEYKAWVTPAANYSPDSHHKNCSSKNSNVAWGFCDSDSKTDNFKIRAQNAAYITVCKFNDLNADGTGDTGEPLIPFWPITATGVDTQSGPIGTVNTQTDQTGCVSFSVSTFDSSNTATVTITEGQVSSEWQETAPLSGAYDSNGLVAASGPTMVSGFTETITVKPGDNVTAPNFGNTCLVQDCGGNTVQLVVTKDANPSFTRTFTWGIGKTVDNAAVYTAGGAAATFNYTVAVTHDSGTDSNWQATGTIKVSNPSLIDLNGVNVTDAVDNGGACTVMNGTNLTVAANSSVQVPYTCTYNTLPVAGTNTATATWDLGTAMGTATVNFDGAPFKAVDTSATATDTFDTVLTTLGTVSYTDPSPTVYTYSHTVSDPAGTCTTHNNTATLTTVDTGTVRNASQSVQDCQGADPTVVKTVVSSLTPTITKSVDKSLVEQAGGSAIFTYTVKVATSNWMVTGQITVTNPNNWEDITVNVTDAIDMGGVCVVNGGVTSVVVPRGSTVVLPYTCTFAQLPSGKGKCFNTASITWDSGAAHTPHNSASYKIEYMFTLLIVTDCFSKQGTHCTPTTLGTVSVPAGGAATYTYSHTITNGAPGTCTAYTNTAQIANGPSASQTVNICNTTTGALALNFWKTANGQSIVTNYCAGTGSTSLVAFLRAYNPFQDLSATATCSAAASYVSSVLRAATCSSSASSCNSMLRAQMLATALDVYFSDPALGGNRIGTYNGLGASTPVLGKVAIDLSKVCSMTDGSTSSTCSGTYEDSRPEFGLTSPCVGMTLSNMLSYANFLSAQNGNPVASPSTGTTWYQQLKPNQVYAKDAFDETNNRVVTLAPAASNCAPSF